MFEKTVTFSRTIVETQSMCYKSKLMKLKEEKDTLCQCNPLFIHEAFSYNKEEKFEHICNSNSLFFIEYDCSGKIYFLSFFSFS